MAWAYLGSLFCQKKESTIGSDSVELRYDGKKIWGPEDMDTNQTKSVDVYQHLPEPRVVSLWELEHVFPDKHLGDITISPTEAGQGGKSQWFLEGAEYTLFYHVELTETT